MYTDSVTMVKNIQNRTKRFNYDKCVLVYNNDMLI